MASRENQGLQLSLIFFVAVTVALSVACYVIWKKGDEHRIAADSNLNQLTQAQEDTRLAQAEARSLKMLLGGYAAETSLTDIQTAHAEDMLYYGMLLQQPVDNYRTLITLYSPPLVQLSEDLAAAEEKVQTLDADLAAARSEETIAVAQFQNANSDLDQQFNATLASLQEPTQQQVDFVDSTEDLVVAMLSTDTARDNLEIAAQADEIEMLRELLSDTEKERDRNARVAAGMRDETVENNDGMVSWVNPDSDSLYINVGSADYLQRQMTFNIYDANSSNLAVAQPKGVIEVTTLLEPHLAEARIVDYNLEDPILPGDLIFSPIWQPGQQLHFALMGKLDIDGDGDDDTEAVRRLITLNGGHIEEDQLLVAADENNPDEEPIYGPKLSIDTRYLVVGELLTASSDERDLLRHNSVLSSAEQYGVEQISLDRLLNLMGYRGSERSVGLGRHANPDDFRPRRGDEDFRERRPSPRGNN